MLAIAVNLCWNWVKSIGSWGNSFIARSQLYPIKCCQGIINYIIVGRDEYSLMLGSFCQLPYGWISFK